nr:PREDICTED: doublesex- and mab-3-related transcription factor 1-like isoform X2 [Bemisia tabaci]
MASDVTSGFQNKSRVNSRAPRCCVRCRNHGLKKLVRGHKRYCPYTLCPCRLCLATKERQVHMAKTIKKRRYFLQDLAMQAHPDPKMPKHPEPIPQMPIIYKPPEVTTLPQGPPGPGPVEPPRDTPPTSPVGSLPPPSHQKAASVKSEASLPTSSPYRTPIDESLWESSIGSKIRTLIEMFNFQRDVDIYSLLYVILRYTTSDVMEVYNKIVEGRVICVERAREWSQQPRYAPPPNLFSNCTSAIGACTLFPIPPATAALLRSTDKQSLPIPCPEISMHHGMHLKQPLLMAMLPRRLS